MQDGFNKTVDMMVTAIKAGVGEDGWNRMTDTEKHDAVMFIAKVTLGALENLEKIDWAKA